MATGNFCFENRCVVVTNEDYEWGNIPLQGEWINNCRNYPSRGLKDYEGKWKTVQIVLTSGYYEHACIDILELDDAFCDLTNHWDYGDMDELFEQMIEDEVITSKEEFKAILSKIGEKPSKEDKDYYGKVWVWYEAFEKEAFKDVYEREMEEANKEVDKIKKEYGYQEVEVSARFSNGETWYSVVDEKVA